MTVNRVGHERFSKSPTSMLEANALIEGVGIRAPLVSGDREPLAPVLASERFDGFHQRSSHSRSTNRLVDHQRRQPRDVARPVEYTHDLSRGNTHDSSGALGHENGGAAAIGHPGQARWHLVARRRIAKLCEKICNTLGVSRVRSANVYVGHDRHGVEFHSSLEATGDGRRATGDGRWVMGDGRWVV
jgi:hypothetical protein